MNTGVRCFDLLCFGKCTSQSDLKLRVQSTEEIPNLVTKNASGDIVFQEPKPMCVIRSPRGHNVWVNIELRAVTTKASDYMCLGIKKRGENDYYDVLYSGNLSRYVDVQEEDVVELIPIISSTKLPTCSPVKAGDSAKITGENTYDFGSSYRVNIALSSERWITQYCDLNKVFGSTSWNCNGCVSVGCVVNRVGAQLVMISTGSSKLACSPNGIRWLNMGGVLTEGEEIGNWDVQPVFGNGIWCVVNWNSVGGIRRSIDYGRTWTKTASIGARVLGFGNNTFMTVTENGEVYASADAECWAQIGTTPKVTNDGSAGYKILIYGNDKWICGNQYGYIYQSKDGRGNWEFLSNELLSTGNWFGGCYANGYFYITNNGGVIKRSTDGKMWAEVTRHNQSGYNIGYYKNKLYAFKYDGSSCFVGLFNPDGTI